MAYYNGIVHVVGQAMRAGVQADVFYSRSTDNGVTFSVPVNLSASATTAFGSFRPQVTAGPNGVFVGWNSEDTNAGGTGEVYVRRSTDSGQTFGAAAIVAGTQNDGVHARITQLFTDSEGATPRLLREQGHERRGGDDPSPHELHGRHLEHGMSP